MKEGGGSGRLRSVGVDLAGVLPLSSSGSGVCRSSVGGYGGRRSGRVAAETPPLVGRAT